MVPTVPAGSTWPATLPVTLPVTCPATPPSWASAGVAIAAVPAVRRIRVLRIVNLLRLTGGGVQKERARAAACFIVRLAGGHDDSGPIAGNDDYFQQLDGRFDRARDAPDRRIFAPTDPALPPARKERGLASVRPARRPEQLV